MDAELEAAINRVGRERVFKRARALGYNPGEPLDKWIWWQIIHDAGNGIPHRTAGVKQEPPSLFRELFGFDL